MKHADVKSSHFANKSSLNFNAKRCQGSDGNQSFAEGQEETNTGISQSLILPAETHTPILAGPFFSSLWFAC